MHKLLVLVTFFFTFIVNSTLAQSRLIWSTTSSIPNSQITDPRSFAVDESGNNYSVNFTQSALSLYTNYVFYAHDASGVKLWEYANDSCLTDCNDKYFNIVPIKDDGAIFIGAYDDITGTQIRIKRIDRHGSLVWQQYWISPFLSVQPITAMLDNSGKLIVGLSAVVNLTDLEDFCVAKFDTAGGLLDWHIELPDDGTTLNPFSEIISGMSIDANNNVYCVGTGMNAGTVKNYFFKIDDTGSLDYQIENTYSGLNSNNFSIQNDGSGNFYTLGFTGSKSQVEKYSEQNGSLIWSEAIEKDSAVISNVGMSIVGNDIFVANNFTYFNADTSVSGGYWDNKHYFLSKLNSSGVLQWQKEYFTLMDSMAIQDGFGGATQLAACNGYLYLLSAQHLNSVDNILLLHRTDLSGNTVWYDTASIYTSPGFFNFDIGCDVYLTRVLNNVNVTEKYTTSPLSAVTDLSVSGELEIYPNPTSNEFSIGLKNSISEKAIVSIYNSIGERIMEDECLFSSNETKFSLSNQPSGLYFVQVILHGKRFSKTLVKR